MAGASWHAPGDATSPTSPTSPASGPVSAATDTSTVLQIDGDAASFWARHAAADVVAHFGSSLRLGLATTEADSRLLSIGPNVLAAAPHPPLLAKFAEQLANPLILILLASALLSFLVGELDDAISISLAVLIVVSVAFVQEYKSERSLEKLNTLVPHKCNRVRDGTLHASVDAADLVPGDIVHFSTGDRIPADIRLIKASNLSIDESSLTGETEPIHKTANLLPPITTSTANNTSNNHQRNQHHNNNHQHQHREQQPLLAAQSNSTNDPHSFIPLHASHLSNSSIASSTESNDAIRYSQGKNNISQQQQTSNGRSPLRDFEFSMDEGGSGDANHSDSSNQDNLYVHNLRTMDTTTTNSNRNTTNGLSPNSNNRIQMNRSGSEGSTGGFNKYNVHLARPASSQGFHAGTTATTALGTPGSLGGSGALLTPPEMHQGGSTSGQTSTSTVAMSDRANIVHMGTLVQSGHGVGIVIATGHQTEFGHVFSMVHDLAPKKTPLQSNMEVLGKQLTLASGCVILIITVMGLLQGKHWKDIFTIAVSLGVAAIPEGLPIVVTVTLALGIFRMAEKQCIVKKLHSVEALGSATVICADKTGTLTKNMMTITSAYIMGNDSYQVVDFTNKNGASDLDSQFRNGKQSLKTFDPTASVANKLLLRIGALCNNSKWDAKKKRFTGQATETAFLDMIRKFGLFDERDHFRRIGEIPFSHESKFMCVQSVRMSDAELKEHHIQGTIKDCPTFDVANADEELFYMKGAFESVASKCTHYLSQSGQVKSLNKDILRLCEKVAGDCAREGLRIMFLAYGQSLNSMVLVGFLAMKDPPRDGVKDTITSLKRSGVKVMVITGDAMDTALSIAKQIGIIEDSDDQTTDSSTGIDGQTSEHHDSYQQQQHPLEQQQPQTHLQQQPQPGAPIRPSPSRLGSTASKCTNDSISTGVHSDSPLFSGSRNGPLFELINRNGLAMSGTEIDELSIEELASRVRTVAVFYRTTPRQKVAIVKALQFNHEVVAMTGDGVNDAPALRLADVGVSMGRGGTDVAKEAADIILVEDDFTLILNAIEEGKSIFYNIQNFLHFQLSTSISALSLVAISTLLGRVSPLNPMQILFINIICDGPVAQSLGVEPIDHDVMSKPPRSKHEPIINRNFMIRVLIFAAVITTGTLSVSPTASLPDLDTGGEDGKIPITDPNQMHDSSMAFTTFVFFSFINALLSRSQSKSVMMSVGLFTNHFFNITVGISIIAQILVTYLPPLQHIFRTAPLSLWDWVRVIFISTGLINVDEVIKMINAHGVKGTISLGITKAAVILSTVGLKSTARYLLHFRPGQIDQQGLMDSRWTSGQRYHAIEDPRAL